MKVTEMQGTPSVALSPTQQWLQLSINVSNLYIPQFLCLCHHKWSSSWWTPRWCIHRPPLL